MSKFGWPLVKAVSTLNGQFCKMLRHLFGCMYKNNIHAGMHFTVGFYKPIIINTIVSQAIAHANFHPCDYNGQWQFLPLCGFIYHHSPCLMSTFQYLLRSSCPYRKDGLVTRQWAHNHVFSEDLQHFLWVLRSFNILWTIVFKADILPTCDFLHCLKDKLLLQARPIHHSANRILDTGSNQRYGTERVWLCETKPAFCKL